MNTGGKKCYQAFANIKRNGKKKINKKIHNDIYRVVSIYYQISMNVQHRLTTALQMAFALMWRDPFSVNVNQDLQGMEKHARVGQKQNN